MSTKEQMPANPDWLDDDFIKQCIKNDTGVSVDEIVVNSFNLQYALPKGENYSSLILRLNVNADFNNSLPKLNGSLQNGTGVDQNGLEFTPPANGDRAYIVKTLVKQEIVTELMNEFSLFWKEVDMYKNIVPNLQLTLKAAGLETKFACRCLNFKEEASLIVMEDLKAQGYILANRIKGADLEHTKLLVLKMARLHAASMKYYEQNTFKDVPEYFYKGMVRIIEDEKLRESSDELFGRKMFTKNIAILAETLSKRPGYEREAQLVTNLIDYGFDILCNVYKHKPGNILNAHLHGDCWINNMMYKYDNSGKPVDVMLVDLQCSQINTVTTEFMYFFLSSVSDDVRERHYEEVLYFYYAHLVDSLIVLGYNGVKPSLRELKQEMFASSSIFLWVLSFLLPIVKVAMKDAGDRSKAESMTFEEIAQITVDNQSNPVFEKTLFATIDLLRKIGTFEYHEKLLASLKK